MNDKSILRILDANFNRAREGLRVAEEYARFALDSAPRTERLKNLRHGLAAAAQAFEVKAGRLADARDTAGDVGTAISTEREHNRESGGEVALASMKRLQEALRVIEEYGKTVSTEAAAQVERLRYDSYEIEAGLFAPQERLARLAQARLYVLVTEALASADAATVTREAVAGGADIIQMREKELEDGAFLKRAEELNQICRSGGALFIVNDRPHIVGLIDADGIHTGQGDLPVHLTRRLVGRERIIGMSTHSPEQLAKSFADGADYAGVGPVFETKTKIHREAAGLEYVRHAAGTAKIPYFCIGSVNRKTLDTVLDAGARAVAVCTGIIAAKDIAAETAWFKQRIAERG